MPAKPSWYDRLEETIEQLQKWPYPLVDRAALQSLLGVGRRRAQQILQPLVRRTLGKNGLAPREEVIAHLRNLAACDAVSFEKGRRARLHAILDQLHSHAREQPRVLVEAQTAVINQEFDSLPPGVQLSPGRIQIDGFRSSDEAKQKLLALILAMGNDPDEFDARITVPDT